MKTRFAILAALAVSLAALPAAVPPPEKLLPSDTLGMVTVPDWDKAAVFYRTAAMSQFWASTEMKAFREKFEEKWKKEFGATMERDLGIKLGDFAELIHGQVTVGFLQSLVTEKDPKGGVVLLADAKDKKDALAKKLGEIKKKWVDAGKEQRVERVRDIEFTTFLWMPTNSAGASGTKGSAAGGAADGDDLRSQTDAKPLKAQLTFALADSLLLVGRDPKDFEKILVRLNGGLAPSLAEVAEFEANALVMFRDARAYAWVNAKALSTLLLKKSETDAGAKGRNANPFAPAPEKVLDGLGIGGLKTIALQVNDTGDGALMNLFIGAPESGRKGLFKILASDAKDASPPPFVPANATKFSRWRIDGRKVWATLEGLLNDISPQLAGMVQMGIEAMGKDKDPNFDLKKMIVDNLGDDIISFEKAPRSSKLADLNAAPTLYLIGSPKPEQLALALKTGVALLGVRPDTMTERELLGRKVYRAKMGTARGAPERSLSFTHAGGYLALTTDDAMLEEFLRSLESPGRGLREVAGIGEAAQKIGGMGSGWFGYENQNESMKALFEAAKKDPALAEKMFSTSSATTVAGIAGASGVGEAGKGMKDWFDFSLLPAFEQVAKYFNFSVNSASAAPDGISFRTYMPTPPQLKK